MFNEIRALFSPSPSPTSPLPSPPAFSSLRRKLTCDCLVVGVWGGRSWVLSPTPARMSQSEEHHAVLMRGLLFDTKPVIVLRHTRLPPEVLSSESANPKLADSFAAYIDRRPWRFCQRNVVMLTSCSSGVCRYFYFCLRFFPLALRPQRRPSLVTNGTFPAPLLPLQKARRFCRTPPGTDRPLGPIDLMLADCGLLSMSTVQGQREEGAYVSSHQSLSSPNVPLGPFVTSPLTLTPSVGIARPSVRDKST